MTALTFTRCPLCRGSGHDEAATGDPDNSGTCRECHGTGRMAVPSPGQVAASPVLFLEGR